MTTFDPPIAPSLHRWLDDAVERRLEARLHQIFERAADELYARVHRYSGAVEAMSIAEPGAPPADEVREPAAVAAELTIQSLGYALAEAFERAVEAAGPLGVRPREVVEAASFGDDLPATLPELRQRSLSTTAAAARLGVNQSRVRQRLLARTLYGFKDGANWWVPEFQFAGDRLVPGAEKVFPELPASASPVAVARWFLLPWADLVINEERETVVSPRTWLLEGRDPAPVIAQARVL